jgi:hypothetical protein
VCGFFVPMVNAPDDGDPLDAATARAAREGDDGGHDSERPRRPGRASRGRACLPRLRCRRLDHGRGRSQRRRVLWIAFARAAKTSESPGRGRPG